MSVNMQTFFSTCLRTWLVDSSGVIYVVGIECQLRLQVACVDEEHASGGHTDHCQQLTHSVEGRIRSI